MGKKFSIPVKKDYLEKPKCIMEARYLVEDRHLQMSIQECAEEIYGHTVAYFCANKIRNIHLSCIQDLIARANPIDLEDGGDTKKRKVMFKTIWCIVPSR